MSQNWDPAFLLDSVLSAVSTWSCDLKCLWPFSATLEDSRNLSLPFPTWASASPA